VPDGNIALQALQHRLREHARDQAEVFVGADAPAVGDGDARALLPAMLQREQPEVGQSGDILPWRVDAEQPTRLARRILVPHGGMSVPDAPTAACYRFNPAM